jgi:hypothetical protein
MQGLGQEGSQFGVEGVGQVQVLSRPLCREKAAAKGQIAWISRSLHNKCIPYLFRLCTKKCWMQLQHVQD